VAGRVLVRNEAAPSLSLDRFRSSPVLDGVTDRQSRTLVTAVTKPSLSSSHSTRRRERSGRTRSYRPHALSCPFPECAVDDPKRRTPPSRRTLEARTRRWVRSRSHLTRPACLRDRRDRALFRRGPRRVSAPRVTHVPWTAGSRSPVIATFPGMFVRTLRFLVPWSSPHARAPGRRERCTWWSSAEWPRRSSIAW